MAIASGIWPASKAQRANVEEAYLSQHHTDIQRLWKEIDDLQKNLNAAFTDGGPVPSVASSSSSSASSSSSSHSSSSSSGCGTTTWTWHFVGGALQWDQTASACTGACTQGDQPDRAGAFNGEVVIVPCVPNQGQCVYKWNVGGSGVWSLFSTGCTGGHSCPGFPSWTPTFTVGADVVRNCI